MSKPVAGWLWQRQAPFPTERRTNTETKSHEGNDHKFRHNQRKRMKYSMKNTVHTLARFAMPATGRNCCGHNGEITSSPAPTSYMKSAKIRQRFGSESIRAPILLHINFPTCCIPSFKTCINIITQKHRF